jgi:hypothetical protein
LEPEKLRILLLKYSKMESSSDIGRINEYFKTFEQLKDDGACGEERLLELVFKHKGDFEKIIAELSE